MNTIYRVIFSVVFLSAGVFRLVNMGRGFDEMEALGLPGFFAYFVVAFEIACGILLAIGKKLNLVLISLSLFIGSALVWGFFSNFKMIVETGPELFVFNTTATDMMLHFVYLLIIIGLIKHMKSEQ